MGFLVSAGVWVGSEGMPPQPRPAVRTPRPAVLVPVYADALPSVGDYPLVSSYSARPQPVPRRGRAIHAETHPLDYGDLDDAYLPAYGAQRTQPLRRLRPSPLRHPQSEGPSIQWQIEQSIDHVACYAGCPPRLPRLPVPVPANRTGETDPHPFTQGDETTWYAALSQTTRPIRRERVRPCSDTVLTRDSEQDDHYIGWAGQSIRPWGLPRKRGLSAASQTMLLDEFEFWFGQQVTPPRREPFHFRANVAPPWLSMFSVAAPGPYYVVAGQVSPAAGAVMGVVREVGED